MTNTPSPFLPLIAGDKIKLAEKRRWKVQETSEHLAILIQKPHLFSRRTNIVMLDTEHETRKDLLGIGGGDLKYFWVLQCTEKDRTNTPAYGAAPWGVEAVNSFRG